MSPAGRGTNRDDSTPSPSPPTPGDRRHGRIRCESATLPSGRVVDLSASGMRVVLRRRPAVRPGDELRTTLNCPGGQVPVTLRVVWVRRCGLFHHELGGEFRDVSAELRRALTELARSLPLNRTVRLEAVPVRIP